MVRPSGILREWEEGSDQFALQPLPVRASCDLSRRRLALGVTFLALLRGTSWGTGIRYVVSSSSCSFVRVRHRSCIFCGALPFLPREFSLPFHTLLTYLKMTERDFSRGLSECRTLQKRRKRCKVTIPKQKLFIP